MRVRAIVPASAGNAGPGFDSFGLAYGLHNEIVADTSRPGELLVEGEGVEHLRSGAANLVALAVKTFEKETGKRLPAHGLRLINRIPFNRGLGSSAAAIVGGLAIADALAGTGLGPDELMHLALLAEDHPDNVSAAIHGGAVLTVFQDGVRGPFVVVPMRVPAAWRAVVHIPDQECRTDEARDLLPPGVPRRHAVFNHSRVGLLVAAFQEERPDYLRLAMQDRLHQPYRAKLFPHMQGVIDAAQAAGAWGACLSGAGPAVLGLASTENAGAVKQAMQKSAGDAGVTGRCEVLEVPAAGVQVLTEKE